MGDFASVKVDRTATVEAMFSMSLFALEFGNSFFLLILAAFFTSAISGVLGLGGGSLLMGFMSFYFPVGALIPTHGAVQLVSNISRAVLSISEIRFDLVGRYLLGSVFGAGIGSFLVIRVPENYFWLTIGAYLLLLTWVPLPKKLPNIPFKYGILGAVSTFLSLFIGITGPLVHPIILRECLDKHSFIGTEAACAGITHTAKIFVFSISSLVLLNYWKVLLPMGLASIAGSFLGKRILTRLPQKYFVQLVKITVTILALRMLAQA